MIAVKRNTDSANFWVSLLSQIFGMFMVVNGIPYTDEMTGEIINAWAMGDYFGLFMFVAGNWGIHITKKIQSGTWSLKFWQSKNAAATFISGILGAFAFFDIAVPENLVSQFVAIILGDHASIWAIIGAVITQFGNFFWHLIFPTKKQAAIAAA